VRLPNAHLAIVPSRKLSDYLLNDSHPDNGGKAAFFFSLGFRLENAEPLAFAFLQIASSAVVTEMVETSHQVYYRCSDRIALGQVTVGQDSLDY
jgi:hypothetical protein